MSNLALLGICLAAGILLRKFNRLPRETPAVLNSFILHISLPAVVLTSLRSIPMTTESLKMASLAWILFGVSILWFLGLAQFTRLWKSNPLGNHKTLGTLILTSGLGNTSFVGFPLLEALYGKGILQSAVLFDQLGTFPVLSTLGIGLASYCSSRRISWRQMIQRIFAFPPTYALLIAIPFNFFPSSDFISDLGTRLGSTLTPLALVSVGFRLQLNRRALGDHYPRLLFGLFFKLFLAPALLGVIVIWIFGWNGEAVRVAVLEAAMAPMITSAIISAEYDLDSELADLMVGIGIPLSLITVPLWAYFL